MTFERAALLREMGLGPLWRLRGVTVADSMRAVDDAVSRVHAPASADAADAANRPAEFRPVASVAVPRSSPAAGSAETLRHGQAPRATPAPSVQPARAVPADEAARAARIHTLEWEALEADMRTCAACRLCEGRNQVVPGVGDRAAEWMLVGEGPGAEEDRRGEPFVGAAGKLLDDMLGAIGLARGQDVYIANAVKCRPPLNRTPQADEIAACLPYLSRQIALVRPRLLIALGRPAAQALLGEEVKINASRGRLFHREGTPVVVTYHPAYLLRNQADKARAWEDLCFARKALAELKRQDG